MKRSWVDKQRESRLNVEREQSGKFEKENINKKLKAGV